MILRNRSWTISAVRLGLLLLAIVAVCEPLPQWVSLR
jgi:hypothetical protein